MQLGVFAFLGCVLMHSALGSIIPVDERPKNNQFDALMSLELSGVPSSEVQELVRKVRQYGEDVIINIYEQSVPNYNVPSNYAYGNRGYNYDSSQYYGNGYYNY